MQSASLNSYNARFNTFLYAVILEEQSGASLTVLSLLARHNRDPWEEAANFARSPRKVVVAQLSSLLSVAMPYSPSHERIRTEAVRLLHLLPSPNIAEPITQNPMWPVITGLLKRIKAVSDLWIRNGRR